VTPTAARGGILHGAMRGDGLDVLVTGGAGFIGSHVVDRLVAGGHRPRIFDQRPSPWHDSAVVDTCIGDLGDVPRLRSAMHDCDVVVHLAAAADVDVVREDPLDAERRNARGTLNVLETARRSGVDRVVYASTIWVYSDTPGDVHEEDAALCAPAHLYTATKLAGELYCRSYRELYGLDYTVLRFGIPYGPRARPAGVVAQFVARALAGEPLVVAGDGRQSRRFVYVEDLADGVVRALRPAAADRTYNLVGSEDTTIAEIAESVRDIVGGVEIQRIPARVGDFAGAPVSGARAARELGWEARTPFVQGLRRYVDWQRAEAASAALAPRVRAKGAVAWLLRRTALAVLAAATIAVMVIGLASLVPIDRDLDVYDMLTATLITLLPLMLAGGFAWPAEARRSVRGICWTIAAFDLVLVHRHPVFAIVAVATALTAGLVVRERPALEVRVATGDG
jgi:UDP-glucose 4-epimerase